MCPGFSNGIIKYLSWVGTRKFRLTRQLRLVSVKEILEKHSKQRQKFLNLRSPGIDSKEFSASLCSLAGWYDNPVFLLGS